MRQSEKAAGFSNCSMHLQAPPVLYHNRVGASRGIDIFRVKLVYKTGKLLKLVFVLQNMTLPSEYLFVIIKSLINTLNDVYLLTNKSCLKYDFSYLVIRM